MRVALAGKSFPRECVRTWHTQPCWTCSAKWAFRASPRSSGRPPLFGPRASFRRSSSRARSSPRWGCSTWRMNSPKTSSASCIAIINGKPHERIGAGLDTSWARWAARVRTPSLPRWRASSFRGGVASPTSARPITATASRTGTVCCGWRTPAPLDIVMAAVPGDNAPPKQIAMNSQPSHSGSDWPIRRKPSAWGNEEEVLRFRHTEEDKNLGLRAHMPGVIGTFSGRISMSRRTTDGGHCSAS